MEDDYHRRSEQEHQLSNDNKSKSDGKRRPAPAKAYEDHDHASDKAHQTAEQYNWVTTRNVGIATLLFSIIAAVSTAGAFWQTKRQADIAQKQLSTSSRPILKLSVVGGSVRENVIPTRVCPHCVGHGRSDSLCSGGGPWRSSFG